MSNISIYGNYYTWRSMQNECDRCGWYPSYTPEMIVSLWREAPLVKKLFEEEKADAAATADPS